MTVAKAKRVNNVHEASKAVLEAKDGSVVLSDGTALLVQQLRWKPCQEIFELIAQGFNAYNKQQDAEFRAGEAAKGAQEVFYAQGFSSEEVSQRAEAAARNIDMVFERLSDARQSMTTVWQLIPERAVWLCTQCTDKDEEFFEELGLADMMKVLMAVVDVNIGQFAQVKDFFTGAMQRWLPGAAAGEQSRPDETDNSGSVIEMKTGKAAQR